MRMKVADFLARHKKVTRVLYPFRPDHPQHNLARAQMDGGGGVVSFEVAGGKSAAFRCANALQLIDISNNLGDAKSLFTHPETTTHQKTDPGGARRRRRHQRACAPVGGAGRHGRSLRRPGSGAESRLRNPSWRNITSSSPGKRARSPSPITTIRAITSSRSRMGRKRLTASAAPAYKGDAGKADPEDLLVASLSSCHMLSFLAIASKKKVTVTYYEDDATAFWKMTPPPAKPAHSGSRA